MHARRLPAITALALAASIVHPVVTGPVPAAAHTGYTSITDDSGADISPDPTVNGTPMNVRVLRPNTAAPTAGWPLVVYMAGDLKNRCAHVNETSTRTTWYTRKAMAEHGFAVLSFNARGLPASYNAGVNPSGTSGCGQLDDATDMNNDSGWDLGGPTDKGDVKGLIDWAVANYSPSGCAATGGVCIDGDKVGLFGYGFDGALKALLMGVPNPPNSQYSSRVKGIVTVGFKEWTVRNLKDVSNDGAGTPAFREVDQGIRAHLPDMHTGNWSHADPSVLLNTTELLAAKYLNTTVPSATTTWLDDRTVVDDNASVDKAAEITTPVFMANAFLDGDASSTTATLAYNKLGATNKYLYLGACGSNYTQLPSADPGPCQTTNKANLRDKVHAFLDRWVKQDTTISVGGPVFWAVPPATNPLSTDNWSVATDAIAAWPPSTNALDSYDVTYCLGGDGVWNDGTCATAAQNTSDRTISNVVGSTGSNPFAFCNGATYGSTEVVSYTTSASGADYKMIGFEADVSMRSDDTTRLQVYADLFTVDGSSVETRVWQGDAQVVPVKRNGTAGTVYRFRFKPAGAAWTLKTGHLLRLKLAANYKKSFAQELIPATYRIKHTDTDPTQFTVTFDL